MREPQSVCRPSNEECCTLQWSPQDHLSEWIVNHIDRFELTFKIDCFSRKSPHPPTLHLFSKQLLSINETFHPIRVQRPADHPDERPHMRLLPEWLIGEICFTVSRHLDYPSKISITRPRLNGLPFGLQAV